MEVGQLQATKPHSQGPLLHVISPPPFVPFLPLHYYYGLWPVQGQETENETLRPPPPVCSRLIRIEEKLHIRYHGGSWHLFLGH